MLILINCASLELPNNKSFHQTIIKDHWLFFLTPSLSLHNQIFQQQPIKISQHLYHHKIKTFLQFALYDGDRSTKDTSGDTTIYDFKSLFINNILTYQKGIKCWFF